MPICYVVLFITDLLYCDFVILLIFCCIDAMWIRKGASQFNGCRETWAGANTIFDHFFLILHFGKYIFLFGIILTLFTSSFFVIFFCCTNKLFKNFFNESLMVEMKCVKIYSQVPMAILEVTQGSVCWRPEKINVSKSQVKQSSFFIWA